MEVHNCYTLYELNEDRSQAEKPLVCFNRPQDWGDPNRWQYHYTRIELESSGKKYINHCHIWQEVKRSAIEACQTIAPTLFMIMMPGTPRELCDRSHLEENDFWLSEWGEQPPYYESETEDDWFDPEDFSEEPELIPPGNSLYCWRVFHPMQNKAIQEAEEEPMPDPPFPTASYIYTMTPDGKGGHSMRSEDDEIVSGILFGTHLPDDQQLSPSWIERGWQIERQPAMEQIA